MRAPYSRTLFELLSEQAARRPDQTAAITRSGAVSYLVLEQRARNRGGASPIRNCARRARRDFDQ